MNRHVTSMVAAAVRCLYVDLDGTLLGPRASLLRGADGGWSSLGARALEACSRAGVEVCLYSGRRQSSVFEAARLIGSSAFVFELGCGLVIDGELEWLTDGVVPSAERGSIFDQIEASGAPALLLDGLRGSSSTTRRGRAGARCRTCSGVRWISRRPPRSWTGRGSGGCGSSTTASSSRSAEQMRGLPVVRAYHLIPAGASKARGSRATCRRADTRRRMCIAVGDSREDMDVATVVGAFWLVANALARDPSLEAEAAGRAGVRIASEGYGAGVYEAVVTTLAER